MKRSGFAVDVSNWQGALSEETIACFIRNNVLRLICGTQNRAICQQQLGAGYQASIELQAYVYLYDNAPFDQQVREALNRADYPITRLWLDCEFATYAPPDVVVERIWLAVETCRALGVPFGIYTGYWWWYPMTNNCEEFADAGIPLWFADYGLGNWPMQHAPSLWAGWSGWGIAEMRQYRGTVGFCDTTVDYNWFEEEVMSKEEEYTRALETRVEDLEKQVACLKTALFSYRALMRAIGREDWGAAESVIKIIIKKQKSV